VLCGYGPGTKDVNRENIVENNLISKIGQLYLGSPGIFVWQSSHNRIANNSIHDLPYNGIAVSGRICWGRWGKKDDRGQCANTVRFDEVEKCGWSAEKRPSTWYEREPFLHTRSNLVVRNDISDTVKVCGDGNCIYISGAGGGNRILENYCHDCPSKHIHSAIRCDDDQNETVIERNIICRIGGAGECLMIKGKNSIIGNVMYDMRPHEIKRHRGYLRFYSGDISGSVIQHNIFYACDPKLNPVADGKPRKGKRGKPDQPASVFRDTAADFNLYWCNKDPEWGARHLNEFKKEGIEAHGIAADPLFADITKDDFHLKSGSPALKIGIRQPVNIKETGVQSHK
jgi:hypothetical protein